MMSHIECEGCVNLLVVRNVNDDVRWAKCMFTKPSLHDSLRDQQEAAKGRLLETLAQCPDRARAARRAGAV